MAVRSVAAPQRQRRRRPKLIVAPVDPPASARAAGLRYVTDSIPGIRRVRAGRGFTYLDPKGRRIRDGDTLARIRSLVIPPAWTDVWISPYPRGHLQATGRDTRGRKQYRYHPRWAETRDETKYERLIDFGEHLPGIRDRVKADLAAPGLSREKVVATVVYLLDKAFLRVGNEEYERENRSFGLTTLKDQHVEIRGSLLRFRFRGKGGKEHVAAVEDRRVAAIVKQCRDIPGQRLFQYHDEAGARKSIDSNHVNRYLKEISGQPFTAKDFRTWAGSVRALHELTEAGGFETEAEANRNVVAAIKDVADALQNTPAVCRKCYVHPDVITAYLEGTLPEFHARAARTKPVKGLTHEEALLLKFLRDRRKASQAA